MRTLSSSSNFQSLSFTYTTDPHITVPGFKNILTQGYELFDHLGLHSVIDSKINSYSNTIVTDKNLVEDVLQLRPIINSGYTIIPTKLQIPIYNDDSTKYLYINGSDETTSKSFTSYTNCRVVYLSTVEKNDNIYFDIELIDNIYARLSHEFDNIKYYLTSNYDDRLLFTSGSPDIATLSLTAIDSTIFNYIIDYDSNRISLYKQLSSGDTKVVGISSSDATNIELIYVSGGNIFTQLPKYSFVFRNNVQDLELDLNTSWISYNRTDLNQLDVEVPLNNLENNFLITAQYSEADSNSIPVNIMTLKNQFSSHGYMNRGDYTNTINFEPGIQFRDYTGIVCANNQELGGDIILNYTIYSNDYITKPDAFTVFKTPDSLYPYSQININDTSISKNGGIGGATPITSDKIFKKKIDTDIADNQYLCSWLSGGKFGVKGLWVDRYYNPERMSASEAMVATNPSYTTYSSFVNQLITDQGITVDFFDKTSDLVFTASGEYIYHRIGNQNIDKYISNFDSLLLFDTLELKRSNNTLVPVSNNTYIFDGDSSAQIMDYNSLNDTGRFTISFWLDSKNWQDSVGHQILGNKSTIGVSIVSDPIITPIITIQDGRYLYYYNSDFVLITKTRIDNNIQGIARFDHLDNHFALTSGGNISKIRCDGSLYDKEFISNTQEYVNYWTSEENIFILTSVDTIIQYNTLTEGLSTFSADSTMGAFCVIDDTIYSVDGEKCLPYKDNLLFVKGRSQIVYQSLDGYTREILFASLSSEEVQPTINDFVVDNSQNVAILHGDYNVSLYSPTRDLIFTQTLSGSFSTDTSLSCSSVAIDIMYEYDRTDHNQHIIILSKDTSDDLYLSKLDYDGEIIRTKKLDIQYNSNVKYNLTNSSYLIEKYKNSKRLQFSLKVMNFYDSTDVSSFETNIDTDLFSSGQHHFALRFDGKQGNYTIFIDGEEYENHQFNPGKYLYNTIFDENMTFGATHFVNGIPLSQFLNQKTKYYAFNCSIADPLIYKDALTDDMIRLLYLRQLNIGDLCFQLPCGQRNNLDRIKHAFTCGLPGYKSNNVRIIVKNIGITSDTIVSQLKTEIMNNISRVVPASMNVSSIEFETYS